MATQAVSNSNSRRPKANTELELFLGTPRRFMRLITPQWPPTLGEHPVLQNIVLDDLQSSDDFCLQTFYALVQKPYNS